MRFLFGLLIGLIVGWFSFGQAIRHYAFRLVTELPWMKWLTLEEAVALGHPKFWCKIILPALKRGGVIETRLRGDLPDEIQKKLKDSDAYAYMLKDNFKYLEFRLINRLRPRKRRSLDIVTLFPGLEPAT